MNEFYFGCGDGSTKKALEYIGPINVMINYASKVNTPPQTTRKLFIDSGGFSFFFKMKDYATPHKHYLKFVEKRKADFFANRDYPCEPELLRKNKTTVKNNQERTIENHIEIMDIIDNEFSNLKHKFVAVIQGWKVDEYLLMLDRMKEQGLLTKRIAIGSICRRGQSQEIRKIVTEIRKNLTKKYELHAFGVKFNMLCYKDVWDALTSADSMAFRFMIVSNGNPIWLQIKEKIELWIKRLEQLKRKHKTQKTITDVMKDDPE